jgi:ribosomal-protein-alanine N-acetyltransferase
MQPLTSAHLTLRPFVPGDASAVFAFMGDPAVMRFSLNGPHPSRRETEDLIEANIARQERLGYAFWAVTEPGVGAGGRVIGMCGLAPFGHGLDGIELAYRLRRDRWGRGYATEAGTTAVGHAFGPLGLDRLIAAVERENTASIRVLEKCGFRHVADRFLAGKDALVFERFRDDVGRG